MLPGVLEDCPDEGLAHTLVAMLRRYEHRLQVTTSWARATNASAKASRRCVGMLARAAVFHRITAMVRMSSALATRKSMARTVVPDTASRETLMSRNGRGLSSVRARSLRS